VRYLRRSFVRHLAADRKSPGTRAAYSAAIAQLEAFLTDQGSPTVVRELQSDHIEAFFVALHERQLRPATILARHRALARFFGWLVEEGELTVSPLTQLPRPTAPLGQPAMLSAGQVEALLATCAGSAFEDLRDAAVIRLFADTGVRLTEMAALQLDDVDLKANAVYLAGPSRTPRGVPFERPTTRALQRYLAARADHDRAYLSALWLGRRGPLTERGVDQAMRHRGQMAGMPTLRPHHFRHTFAQQYLAGGGNGRDLMRLVGWMSGQMLSRYRVDARAERLRAEWLRLGDRL
jgi:site-specific recombinase XerC